MIDEESTRGAKILAEVFRCDIQIGVCNERD